MTILYRLEVKCDKCRRELQWCESDSVNEIAQFLYLARSCAHCDREKALAERESDR